MFMIEILDQFTEFEIFEISQVTGGRFQNSIKVNKVSLSQIS